MWGVDLCTMGFQKPTDVSDLDALDSKDSSEVLVPKWTRVWDQAMNAYNAKKSRLEAESRAREAAEEEEAGGSEEDNAPLLSANINSEDPKPSKRPKIPPVAPPSILWRLVVLFKWHILGAMFLKLLSDLLQFGNPLLLSALIKFIENPELPLWYGVVLAVLIFLASELSSIFVINYYYMMYCVGARIQSVLTAAVYQKTLRLSNAARRNKTVGEIVNLMAIDVDRFVQLTPQTQQYWSTPVQIVLAMYFLWQQVGVAAMSGIIVMILLLPANFLITMQTKKYQLKQMGIKDERTKMMSELLSGIKVIKLYSWEIPLGEVITELRNKELVLIRKAAFLRTFSYMLNNASPFLVAASTFTAFLWADESNVLTPEIAFVSLTLFNQLRTPMSTVAELISQTVQVFVSNQRLKEFLVAEELVLEDEEKTLQTTNALGSSFPRRSFLPPVSADIVDVRDATVTWDREDPSTVISDLNLTVSRGQLIAVIGRVGAGKSSLLQAILGEMECLRGRIQVNGSVAYLSQQPWMMNDSVRANIVFGQRYDEVFYNRVMDACCLYSDMSMLASGDMTEIGEKGINLSGGQKARISLARGVYQNRDVYLLDDPLSAVDAHVGKQLFTNVIGPEGILRNKTRILVTHELSYLKYADSIVIMADGAIKNEGSYAELSRTGALTQLIKECSEEKEAAAAVEVDEDEYFNSVDDDHHSDDLFEDDQNSVDLMLGTSMMSTVSGIIARRRPSVGTRIPKRRRHSTARESVVSTEANGRQLTGVERVETGRVKARVYLAYFQAMGTWLSILFAFGMIASTVASMARNLWLTDWSNDNAKSAANFSAQEQMPVSIRLGVYAAVGFSEVALVFFGMSALLFGGVAASRRLHAPLLRAILRAPMRFFDITPFGRILNRCGKDIEIIDFLLPFNVQFFAQCVLQVVSTLVIIMISTPIFGVVVVPLTITYLIILRYYISISRQLKRFESTTRSPIYSHLSETINGASTIRAYRNVDCFCRMAEQKLDTHVQCRYLSYIANRWLSLRLELIGNCVVLFAALFATLTRETTSAGVLGLSVSYAVNITFVLNFAVRQISKLETNIVAVERVNEYAEVEAEADWVVENNRPMVGWPQLGAVEFKGYSTRYRPGLELVVKHINARIEPGQRVGIVGRTGAGKSSLTLALFRLIEPAEGAIVIDGVDIATIGLHDLRSRLTIIPQDPCLFSGSLRFNLDPFGRHSDHELWQVLEMAHLKDFAAGLTDGLSQEITEGGGNLSVGQRQLLCLARALLRRSTILVLDEATASVDLATDVLIQQTIRREFARCTVLTIAHRLHTIADYDLVLVLDGGVVREFDAPARLLANPHSLYASMVANAQEPNGTAD